LKCSRRDIRRDPEGCFGIAANRGDGACKVGPGRFEQQDVAFAGRIAVSHGWQRLEIDLDRFKSILGNRRAVGHHNRIGSPTWRTLPVRDDGLRYCLSAGNGSCRIGMTTVPDRRYRPP
jgi:hypothetical protein